MEPYVTIESLPSKTAEWLEAIRTYNTHDYPLDPESALIVVDMQRFFLDSNSPTFTPGGPPIIDNVKQLIDNFRETGKPVIYTCHVHDPNLTDAGIMQWWWDGMCFEGTEEALVHRAISPRANEKIIFKHRYSAFYNTDLETVLRVLKIRDVVIAGIMTNMCCESTARDAYYRDYRVHFSADATGSVTEEMHLASLLNLAFGFARVTTAASIISELKSGQS
ncbi:MAG: isochorismatase family protein [candidate division Zixibacteria bacterium]|nr:isochorismatase family protein [candidate division Zixibacteria bacterium]